MKRQNTYVRFGRTFTYHPKGARKKYARFLRTKCTYEYVKVGDGESLPLAENGEEHVHFTASSGCVLVENFDEAIRIKTFKYTVFSNEYDLALIKMEHKVTEYSGVTSICYKSAPLIDTVTYKNPYYVAAYGSKGYYLNLIIDKEREDQFR